MAPCQVLKLINALKSQIFMLVIRKLVNDDINIIRSRLKDSSSQHGFEPGLNKEVIDKYLPMITTRLERHYSQASLDDFN
jgi:hypothetical protein